MRSAIVPGVPPPGAAKRPSVRRRSHEFRGLAPTSITLRPASSPGHPGSPSATIVPSSPGCTAQAAIEGWAGGHNHLSPTATSQHRQCHAAASGCRVRPACRGPRGCPPVPSLFLSPFLRGTGQGMVKRPPTNRPGHSHSRKGPSPSPGSAEARLCRGPRGCPPCPFSLLPFLARKGPGDGETPANRLGQTHRVIARPPNPAC